MTEKFLKLVFDGNETYDGAGVRLRRMFGGNSTALLTDPFLLLDQFGSSVKEEYEKGFPWHPHRGIETVTYLLQGKVVHEDSNGNRGTIYPSDVQWMSAASGIYHQEMPSGMDPGNAEESVFRYIDEWKICDEKLGYWVDQTKSYVTMRPDYMESEWWAIAELYRKGLLRKDFKIVPYCPRCGTSLSSHEVAQGYEDTKDPSVFVKFREMGNQNRYFLVWTTTPWTLPSNQFLAVNVKMEYVLARVGSEEFYLSTDLVGKILGESAVILEKFSGRNLLGKRYEQIIPLIKETQNVFRVVAGDFVGTDEGTGIVHVAPAFGADDFEIGKSENVSIINPVDTSGRFNSGDLPWNGVFVKDADTDIIVYLKKRGSLFKSEKYLHTYPFCYRCKSPLLYYPLDTWFILVSKIRDKLVSNNARINWFPEHMKEGRFGNFLDEAKDWALSRNRYWGTPIPIWSCLEGHIEVIGSRAELEKRSGNVPADLHRPFIDKVKFDCHECGKQMTREPYVMDTWFDSGSAPYAAMHYPFENGFNPAEDIPMDFISEAVDQTRGWFYVLHAIGSLLFDTNTFSNCVVMEFVLDERGKKMSKSQGNSTLSIDLLERVGADPLRLFLLSGAPWKTRNLDFKVIDELSRKTFQTMSNVYQFYSSNANLDGYNHEMGGKPSELLDRWLISRLNTLILDCAREMDAYQMHTALKYVQDFIDELSNFYLRLSVQSSHDGFRFIIMSGRPLKEPVWWSGPIVMDSREKLNQAFLDLKNGNSIRNRNPAFEELS